MNEKRKRVALNQWYKFLNYAVGVGSKPANTKTGVIDTEFRANMRTYTCGMDGHKQHNKKEFNLLFGAYTDFKCQPMLVGVSAERLSAGTTKLVFEFAKQHQSQVDEMFERMKQFSPFCAKRVDYGFAMAVRIPERKLDMIQKPARPAKPAIKETISISNISIEELKQQIAAIEIEIKRRQRGELDVLMEDYVREREKLVQMNVAIMKIAKSHGLGSEYSERLSTHAL